jgi:hypothetical protein
LFIIPVEEFPVKALLKKILFLVKGPQFSIAHQKFLWYHISSRIIIICL